MNQLANFVAWMIAGAGLGVALMMNVGPWLFWHLYIEKYGWDWSPTVILLPAWGVLMFVSTVAGIGKILAILKK